MRIVKVAHGDYIVLAAYLALVVSRTLGWHPLVSILIVAPVMFVVGYLLQRGLLNPTVGNDIPPPLRFGLSVVIQNVLLQVFSADPVVLQAGWIETASLNIGDKFAVAGCLY